MAGGGNSGKNRRAEITGNLSTRSALTNMRRELDLDLIFPVKDEPSARLMRLKAECLCNAGVITEREKQAVDTKAANARCKEAA